MFTKQKMTSAVVINQVALTEALNGMKHERCEKAIECHHPCHESSLGCAFIKSEFIMLIFYLTGSYPSETPSVGKKTDVTRANVEEARGEAGSSQTATRREQAAKCHSLMFTFCAVLLRSNPKKPWRVNRMQNQRLPGSVPEQGDAGMVQEATLVWGFQR